MQHLITRAWPDFESGGDVQLVASAIAKQVPVAQRQDRRVYEKFVSNRRRALHQGDDSTGEAGVEGSRIVGLRGGRVHLWSELRTH